jgi:hypothetical protein
MIMVAAAALGQMEFKSKNTVTLYLYFDQAEEYSNPLP